MSEKNKIFDFITYSTIYYNRVSQDFRFEHKNSDSKLSEE